MTRKTATVENVAEADASKDYIVLTPVEHGGVIYREDEIIALTDEQAAHPLEVGAVKPKAAE